MAHDHTAYMREWSKKNRARLRDLHRAKRDRLQLALTPLPQPCSKCGVPILMTPARVANRTYKCNRCRTRPTTSEARRRHVNADYHRYPEKYLARRIVSQAIARGEIQRGPCVRCGNAKTQGHHADYAKPLDVTWLCQWCHSIEHIEMKAKAIA